jgi:RimJ/RimL family protein N-acetyltransferase
LPSPSPWLVTLRLALREFTLADAGDMFRLDSDPRVTHYVANGKPTPRTEIDTRLARIVRNYAIYPGLGSWYATRRDTDAFVGWYTLRSIVADLRRRGRLPAVIRRVGAGTGHRGRHRACSLCVRRPRSRARHWRHASRQSGVAARP